MIFLTIGTQLTFDRLIIAMDEWAGNNPHVEVFAQIGNTSFKPNNMKFSNYINPQDFTSLMCRTELIVSHAGMGTIISSLIAQKPIIVMARDSDLGEHRNQHQKSTARKFSELDGCNACFDKTGLFNLLDNRGGFKSGVINNKNQSFSLAIARKIQALIE
ncbi:glycosyltransferase [Pseudocolwellia sp. AS88]|jgi:UDP-N-acetylglucosamine transferase subunit ALG13|uniref:glycosyltransferase n=1 Tax=Pseudocolwellia sp. AS88 TaxID=3063958 RepID=UPI0026F1BC95|nr:glycosyltransferase [Pseudocolwellia sp. AS88]MDO7086717.1 glycosyltransferase [Pseudocolwellia sp. AS88]